MTTAAWPEIIPLRLAEFEFAVDEPWAGQTGVVVAYAVRRSGRVILFDTGFGFGSAELEARYHPKAARIVDALGEAGIDVAAIDAVVNCHLHVDHAGQNSALPGVTIFVQPTELAAAREGGYTILDWIEGPDVRYAVVAGDHEIEPGIRVISTPGHSPGHQSLVVDGPGGPAILAGQACYGHGEWAGDLAAREGRSSAWDPAAYEASIERLRALRPARVFFGHDVRTWLR